MNYFWMILLLFTPTFAGNYKKVTEGKRLRITPRTEGRLEMTKSGYLVAEIVPHLSANDIWKSVLYLRNDSGFTANFFLEFYNPSGDLVNVTFQDSDGSGWLTGATYERNLTGYEIISLEFDSAQNASSFQVFIFTEDNVFYSAEALFNRYDGNTKQASVGVKGTYPEYNIIMNVEERTDLYTDNFNFRAFAITNTEESPCNCTVDLYDDGANGANLEGPILRNDHDVRMNGRGKAVWYISDLFNVEQLPKGFGYVMITCNRQVTGMGLTFEEYSPIAGSVPMDAIQFNKNKTQTEVRP
jgi:hypothetical protein